MTEILTIPQLKSLIARTEEDIKGKEGALHRKRGELNGLRIRLNDFMGEDGLRYETREALGKEWLHLVKNYNRIGWNLRDKQGSEPCGASLWNDIIFSLLPSEIDYIVKNWKECKVWTSEWEEENAPN